MSVSKSDQSIKITNLNPKLFISDLYDSLVNLVDIVAENVLAKHTENDPFNDQTLAEKNQQVEQLNCDETISIFDKREGNMFADP